MFSFLKLPHQKGTYQGSNVEQQIQLHARVQYEKVQTNFGILTEASIQTNAEVKLVLEQNNVTLDSFNVLQDDSKTEVIVKDLETTNQFGQTYLPGFEPFQPIISSSFNNLDHQQIFGVYFGRTYDFYERNRYERTTTERYYYYPNLDKVRIENLTESMSFYPGNRKQYDPSLKLVDGNKFIEMNKDEEPKLIEKLELIKKSF